MPSEHGDPLQAAPGTTLLVAGQVFAFVRRVPVRFWCLHPHMVIGQGEVGLVCLSLVWFGLAAARICCLHLRMICHPIVFFSFFSFFFVLHLRMVCHPFVFFSCCDMCPGISAVYLLLCLIFFFFCLFFVYLLLCLIIFCHFFLYLLFYLVIFSHFFFCFFLRVTVTCRTGKSKGEKGH